MSDVQSITDEIVRTTAAPPVTRSAKKPAVAKVRLCLDPEVKFDLDEAEARLAKAERDADRAAQGLGDVGAATTTLADAKAAVDALRASADEHTVEFRFRAIGRHQLTELRKAHPPTEAQRAEFQADAKAAGKPAAQQVGPEWDDETFPPALIAASCVSHRYDYPAALELWNGDEWSFAECQALFRAAWQVNQMLAAR